VTSSSSPSAPRDTVLSTDVTPATGGRVLPNEPTTKSCTLSLKKETSLGRGVNHDVTRSTTIADAIHVPSLVLRVPPNASRVSYTSSIGLLVAAAASTGGHVPGGFSKVPSESCVRVTSLDHPPRGVTDTPRGLELPRGPDTHRGLELPCGPDAPKGLELPRGLVDGLSQFFTPSNKRNSRVSQNAVRGAPGSRGGAQKPPRLPLPSAAAVESRNEVKSLAPLTISWRTDKGTANGAVPSWRCVDVTNSPLRGQFSEAVILTRGEGTSCSQSSSARTRKHDQSRQPGRGHSKKPLSTGLTSDEVNIRPSVIVSNADQGELRTDPLSLRDSLPLSNSARSDPVSVRRVSLLPPATYSTSSADSVVTHRDFSASLSDYDTKHCTTRHEPPSLHTTRTCMSQSSTSHSSMTTQSSVTLSSTSRSREQLTDGLSHFFATTGKRRTCVASRATDVPVKSRDGCLAATSPSSQSHAGSNGDRRDRSRSMSYSRHDVMTSSGLQDSANDTESSSTTDRSRVSAEADDGTTLSKIGPALIALRNAWRGLTPARSVSESTDSRSVVSDVRIPDLHGSNESSSGIESSGKISRSRNISSSPVPLINEQSGTILDVVSVHPDVVPLAGGRGTEVSLEVGSRVSSAPLDNTQEETRNSLMMSMFTPFTVLFQYFNYFLFRYLIIH